MQPTDLLISDHVIHFWKDLDSFALHSPKISACLEQINFTWDFLFYQRNVLKIKCTLPYFFNSIFVPLKVFLGGWGVVTACTFPTLYVTVLNRITVSNRGKPKCSERNQCCFVNHNFLRFNMDLWDEKLATNHLSYDTALCYSSNMTKSLILFRHGK